MTEFTLDALMLLAGVGAVLAYAIPRIVKQVSRGKGKS